MVDGGNINNKVEKITFNSLFLYITYCQHKFKLIIIGFDQHVRKQMLKKTPFEWLKLQCPLGGSLIMNLKF